MNQIHNQEEMYKKIEPITLIVYSLHQIAILTLGISQNWVNWAPLIVFTMLVISLLAYAGKYSDFHGRETIYVSAVMVSIVIYSIMNVTLQDVLMQFLSILVLVGLCGFLDILRIPVIALTFLVIYHSVFAHTREDNPVTTMIMVANLILGILLIFIWVKKRNETQKQLMQVIHELQEAENTKDNFLANVSHEIRTPINTINGMSELILQEDTSQKIRNHTLDILGASRSLVTVINDILDFSSLQHNQIELVEDNYNISSVINDIVNLAMAIKADKNIELIVDCNAKLPCGLMGDSQKIMRVIVNLISNAIKFTEDGGVTVSIDFRKESYGGNLVISVKDTGIGMSEESVEKLFTSYNQVDTSRSRNAGGIGLGLAITQSLVYAMGGVITIQSKLNKGTTVNVVIPQKITDEKPIAELPPRSEVNVIAYLDLENVRLPGVRDGYMQMIEHMQEQLGVHCHICHNIEELKRRIRWDQYTHVFVGFQEYMEAPAFYHSLLPDTRTVVAIDHSKENQIVDKDIIRIYKPIFILPVVSVLKGYSDNRRINRLVHRQSFVARDVKVLIVDDNEMNIRVVTGLLEKYKIQAEPAQSGMEALKKIESMDFDCVFMDHMMPGMDGIETLHRIRDKVGSYYKTVPVIALTANAVPGAREMFLKEGFADFISKPIENQALEHVLLNNLSTLKLEMIEEENTKQYGYNQSERQKLLEEKINMLHGETFEKEQSTVAVYQASSTFAVGDLDVDTGIMYCGGKESYISILEEYAKKKEENWRLAQESFEQEDWKNYTIQVHAIKSSMLTIGAKNLSEQAKKLEMAGKSSNLDYIMNNHEAMIREYKRVIAEIIACPFVVVKQQNSNTADEQETTEHDVIELSEAEFDKKVNLLEEAMFELDGDAMTQILQELCDCAYHGVTLKEQLGDVIRKVEMSDYMSAFECVSRLQEELKG